MDEKEKEDMALEWDRSTLRYFLSKLTKNQLIDSLIKVLFNLFPENRERRLKVMKPLVTTIQAYEIIQGKHSLEGYSEKHTAELRAAIKEIRGGA